jgi:hypothetical protein
MLPRWSMLFVVRILVCVVTCGASGHLLHSEGLVLKAVESSVRMPEYVLIVDRPSDGVACPPLLQCICTFLRECTDEVDVSTDFPRSYGRLTCIGGLNGRSVATYTAKYMSVGVHADVESRARSRVLEHYYCSEWGISDDGNAQRISGSMWNDCGFRDQDPSSLPRLEGVSTLLDAEKEDDQACECDDGTQNRDVIQAMSCTKLRMTAFSFLGILLIFLGRRFLVYGERLRNSYCDVSWWSGYAISTLGGTILALILMGFAAQLVFP